MGTAKSREEYSYITLNEISDAVKEVFGGSFVYRTSKPGADSVSLRAAIRQDEEFMTLFSRVLWDEFIPSGSKTAGSKLSTLFNRKMTYINRHGLVSAKKEFYKLLTPELFQLEVRHISDELIHLGARKSAHGSDFFSESRITLDENRTLDYTAAKASLRNSLCEKLFDLIEDEKYKVSLAPLRTAMQGCGFITCSSIADEHLEEVLAALLLLSLNLFESCDSEHSEIVDRIISFIESGKKDKDGDDLSRSEVSLALFSLSERCAEALREKDSLGKTEIVDILRDILN